jgi:hypothetical protein
MNQTSPGLPIGVSSFGRIIKENLAYADKTPWLARLAEGEDKFALLTRPAKFGKTLAVSALEALLKGEAELFAGLGAAEKLGLPAFAPRPVVRLSLRGSAGAWSPGALELSLREAVSRSALRLGLQTDPEVQSGAALSGLLSRLARGGGPKPAVLVDDYDAPVKKILFGPAEDQGATSALRAFYASLKDSADQTSLLFMTGSFRRSACGLMDALSHVRDISLEPAWGEFLGFTQGELERCFAGRIMESAQACGVSANKLLEGFREFYFGFSFDGASRVYNPHAALQFFKNGGRRLLNFWFVTGPVRATRHLLKNGCPSPGALGGLRISEESAREPGGHDPEAPWKFPLQSGYLCLDRSPAGGGYALRCPNREVEVSLARLTAQSLFPDRASFEGACALLTGALGDCDAEGVASALNSIIKALPSSGAFAEASPQRRPEAGAGDGFADTRARLVRSSVLSLILGCGLRATSSPAASGRGSDIFFAHRGRQWILALRPDGGKGAGSQPASLAARELLSGANPPKSGCAIMALAVSLGPDGASVADWELAEGGAGARPLSALAD